MKQDDFCCGHSLHLQHSIFREIASGVPEICDFKNWLSFFVFFSYYFSSSFRTLTKTAIKRERHIRTQKGGIKAHLCTNFSWNTINRQRVISDYSRKITPICCHAYRVNRVWEEAETRWVNRLTIEPQTLSNYKPGRYNEKTNSV